ncbi:ArsR/SmtB family transcription factor [Bdellovibrio bacteriovorus]|uniref:ArsR/SmtB family transcription factor n=1 Tax=Bdellovibrio bacteriovorus TaxID=959 RepID=UPI003D077C6B
MATTAQKKQAALKDLVEVFDSHFFKAMAEPVRIEILKFLLINGRSDVATVAKVIKKDRSVISRHLHHLNEAGLLKHEKVSRNSYFEIDADGFRVKVYALFQKVDRAIKDCCP